LPFNRIVVIARSKATKQSISPARKYGMLRGACHRARIRATRWLAMTRSRTWFKFQTATRSSFRGAAKRWARNP